MDDLTKLTPDELKAKLNCNARSSPLYQDILNELMRRLTPPTVTGDIGKLLDEVAHMPGLGFSRTMDELRLAVADLQDLIGELVGNDDAVSVAGDCVIYHYCKWCSEDINLLEHHNCTNPECPAVRARAELEMQNG